MLRADYSYVLMVVEEWADPDVAARALMPLSRKVKHIDFLVVV